VNHDLVLPSLWNDIETLEDKVPQLSFISDELVAYRCGGGAGGTGAVSTAGVLLEILTAAEPALDSAH